MKESELNRLIDNLLHPYFKDSKAVVVLDSVLHAAVERNPQLSFKKFLRYNLKHLLRR